MTQEDYDKMMLDPVQLIGHFRNMPKLANKATWEKALGYLKKYVEHHSKNV